MNRKVNIDRELGKLIRFLEWKKQLEYDVLVCFPDEIQIDNALLVLRHLKNNVSNLEYVVKEIKKNEK